jgi:hypothetical protein
MNVGISTEHLRFDGSSVRAVTLEAFEVWRYSRYARGSKRAVDKHREPKVTAARAGASAGIIADSLEVQAV